MGEATRPWRTGSALPTTAVLAGGTLFVTGVVLGPLAAVRFATALQRSAASCGLAPGHDLAWFAVAANVIAVALAGVAIVAELRWRRPATRPIAVVLASVVVGASMFGAALNLFIVHEIGICATLFG
ncbi:MAG TPA: hypothetical protein VH352_18625 [Pseudonocardiaceae bacterium]|jgi:hypothetical protein|nr:hypothetical protein [Pseudonocardiaceae bacterium]